MKMFGLVLGLVLFAIGANAQESLCLNEAVTQTRAKVQEHYANKGINAKLGFIQAVDLSGITSYGPNQITAFQIEPVNYTTYTILGSLNFEGKGKFIDYGFYVRVAIDSCKVLKVALLRVGDSPFMRAVATAPAHVNGNGLASQEMTVRPIETPQDGSPQIGYTFVGPGEVSQPVENDTYLNLLRKRADGMALARH